jgi:hypothetical protein
VVFHIQILQVSPFRFDGGLRAYLQSHWVEDSLIAFSTASRDSPVRF